MKINVLMCGGRRIGKTSIMAAIQKNVQDMFPSGDIVLDMEKSNSLILYRRDQEALFGPESEEKSTTFADLNPSFEKSEYLCTVHLKDRKSNIQLNFIDVPGEWFVGKAHHDTVIELIRTSQVLLIAIDSPHLMEKDGKYHQVYNRANILTDKIKEALQGEDQKRMVLFVPLKCERYKKRDRMSELADSVKENYEDLISYLCGGEKSDLYTVGITPVITMGGLEFLRFVRPMDEDDNYVCDENGDPLEDVGFDPQTGQLTMQWLAEYMYLMDDYGDHFYEPHDCEQPLLYVLLFLIGIGKKRTQGFLRGIWANIRQLPNQEILEACKTILIDKRYDNIEDGYEILQDPDKVLSIS